jgi:hypothetical protein
VLLCDDPESWVASDEVKKICSGADEQQASERAGAALLSRARNSHLGDIAAAAARDPSRTLWVALGPGSGVDLSADRQPLPVDAYSGHAGAVASEHRKQSARGRARASRAHGDRLVGLAGGISLAL